MKNVIYTDTFVSKAGTVYRADIWSTRTADQARTAVEVGSPHNTPVKIEWSEVDKLSPVHSSVATLIIESETDRQFLELYTVVPGEIGLNIYRSGVLYWSGTLDPELYAEPYSQSYGYDVTLNFADFAILDRLDWDQTAFMTPDAIIRYCVGLSGIDLLSYDFKVATTLSDGRAALTNSLINCANFYDEEGEPMTVREVLDETLRPFGLMLRQKAGVIHVCDLHSLSALTATPVVWSSTDSGLSIDKVYSRAVLRFSPYATNTLLEGVVDPSTVVAEQTKEVTVDVNGSALPGFYCDLDSSSVGLIIDSSARYFKLRSVRSGEDCSGVAVEVPTLLTASMGLVSTYSELFRIADKVYLPAITDASKYNISVSLDLLFSMLENPFEDAPEAVASAYNTWKSSINQLYIPIKMRVLDGEGNCLCHYNNGDLLLNGFNGFMTYGWQDGDYPAGNKCFLSFYSTGDWNNGQYPSGWLANNLVCLKLKQGTSTVEISPNTKFYSQHTGSGDIFVMPPYSGYLDISVGKGILTRSNGEDSSATVQASSIWALYKGLTVGIVGKYGEEISNEDVLLKSKLQLAAKEQLDIDTIVGTQADYVPGARGLLYDAANKSVLTQLMRAGRTDSIERLLLGTLYSNYDRRRIVLSGSVEIVSSYGVYSEASTAGKFLQLSEMQTLLDDESEMSMVQFVGDEYDAVLI